MKVGFPEAIGLLKDIDVRAAGITIGDGPGREIEKEHEAARWPTLELDAEYAPLASDARAILRRKTLLGETFVEITPRRRRRRAELPDGGRLRDSRSRRAVELDEILQTYDPHDPAGVPDLAAAARASRSASAARTLNERARPAARRSPRARADLLGGARRAARARCAGLVRDTGEVYGALTQDEGQLRALIRNSHRAVQPDRRRSARAWRRRSTSSRRSSTSRG